MKYSLSRIRRPGTLRKLAGALGLLLALGLLVTSAVPAMGALQPGHKFFGVVTIDGAPAPNGTLVEAKIGAVTFESQLVQQVSAPGQYGWAEEFMVPPDDPETGAKEGGVQGDTVDFYVDGALAASYTFFKPNDSYIGYENITNLDLAITTDGGGDQQEGPYDLEVTSTGCCDITVDGYGTVDAGNTNTFSVEADTQVTLTAVEGVQCEFVGWEVDGTPWQANPIVITMDGNHTAVATCQTVEPQDGDGSVLSIHLVQGWNTFSTPIALDPSMDTWGEFVAVNGLDVDVIFCYDSTLKQWVYCLPETPLEPLEGFYVCMGSAGTAEILPNPAQTAPPVKSLVAGLNCIGLASMQGEDAKSFLTTVYEVPNSTGYTLVINPPINVPNDWDNNVYLRDGETPPTMNVGKAYWVNMLNPGDLVGFTSTPLEP